MPYKKTRARLEFESEAKKLLSLARRISYNKVVLDYQHKNLIYQSSIVLLSSAIEEYLRIVMEDLFYNYRIKGATLSDIPENARSYALFIRQKGHFESYIFQKNELKVLDDLKVSNPLYEIVNGSAVYNSHVTALNILDGKKYPSPENVKVLYNRIGIKNIFHTIRIGSPTDYKLLLESFLDIRQTIAHQQAMNLTFTDIKRNFDNISDLINKLDRALYLHICRTSGQVFWG